MFVFYENILQIDNLPYDNYFVFSTLQLFSVADITVLTKINFLSKLISGKIDSPYHLSCINFIVSSFSFRNIYHFYITIFSTKYATNEPIMRIMQTTIWNQLSLIYDLCVFLLI